MSEYDGLGFDAVPFSLEWLRLPAEWRDESDRLVVRAPGLTDWFVDPISARAVRTAPVLAGPPPTGVYADDDHWAKLALEVTAAGPTIVSVVTDAFSDDCNSTVLGQRSARLRLARVGEAIAFHASDGGARWELVRVFRPASAAPRIGFICQAPTGAGCTGSFDAIAFTARTLGDIRDGS